METEASDKKGSIVAVACNLSDLELGCSKTLSAFNSNGHQVSFILVPGGGSKRSSDKTKKAVRRIFPRNLYGAFSDYCFFVEVFDYSVVTQSNVSMIRSLLERIRPSLVFIPFIKALDRRRRILGCSSLLACRGIKNVLMYELDDNPSFLPSVAFQNKRNANLIELEKKGSINNDNKKKFDVSSVYGNVARARGGVTETFQSHRIVILDDDNDKKGLF